MQLRDNPGRLIQELEEQARGVRDQFSDLLGVADAVTGFATEVRDALTEIKTLLIAVRDSNIEPIRYDDAQVETLIRRVRVTTAGTSLQGPGIAVPKGFTTVIRMRRHSGTPNGYVALSEHAVSSTDTRIEMRDNDSVSINVSNWSKLWFDADSSNTDFELIVEQ